MPRDRTPPPTHLGYALKQAQHALRNYMDEQLRPLGLTVPQYALLSAIEAGPNRSNADLARTAFITPQSMQGVLANLEAAGLVLREADAQHGRRKLSQLTANGRESVRRAHRRVDQVEEQLAAAVAPLDAGEIEVLLNRLRDAFTRQQRPVTAPADSSATL